MTIEVSVHDTSGDPGKYLKMVECPLCPAKRGQDYQQFAVHLDENHDFSDLF